MSVVACTVHSTFREKKEKRSWEWPDHQLQHSEHSSSSLVQEVKGLKINIKRKKEERQEEEQATGDILQVVQERK